MGTTAYHETVTHTGPEDVDTDTRTITNADTGALVSWKAWISCYPHSTTSSRTYVQADACPSGEERLTTLTGGAIASNVSWQPGTAVLAPPVEPVLQLEDGEFAGAARTTNGETLTVFQVTGAILSSKPNYRPEIAVPGGGLVASSQGVHYAFDGAGIDVGQRQPMPMQSWSGHAYAIDSTLTRLSTRPTLLSGPSFWAQPQGNPSGTGAKPGIKDIDRVAIAALGLTWDLAERVEFGGNICRTPAGNTSTQPRSRTEILDSYRLTTSRSLCVGMAT